MMSFTERGVDVGVYPWSSVGKIYNSTGGACTGALVGANKVLTAAHCIFNARTRQFVRPEMIHVLLGYERGNYRGHFIVARHDSGPGYDAGTAAKTFASDWAVLTIASSVDDSFRPLDLSVPAAKESVDHASGLRARSRLRYDRRYRLSHCRGA